MIIVKGADNGGFHLNHAVMVSATEDISRMRPPEVLPGKVFIRSRDV